MSGSAYAKLPPRRAPLGPNVVQDNGCWYPWVPPYYVPPYIPPATPHDQPIPQATPHDQPPQPATPQDQPPQPAIPQDQPPGSSTPPPSSAPQGNPADTAHLTGQHDGRRGLWRPELFQTPSDKFHYRLGWKEGKQRRRFAANPRVKKATVVPHSTILKPHF